MNAHLCQPIPELIEPALRSAMGSIEEVAPGRWRATPKDAFMPLLLAFTKEAFLTLTADVPPDLLRSPWELLKANAVLAGLAKFAFAPTGTVLRADIPIHPGSNLVLRLDQACRAIACALRLSPATPQSPPLSAEAETRMDLGDLCEKAGWPFTSRHAEHCAVVLESRDGGHTALVSTEPETLRVFTEIALWNTLSADSREALAALLLEANARVMLVRASIAEEETGGVAQLEVVFGTPVSSADLGCALEALSAGSQLCAGVAELLQNETAAKLFLSVRGGPRDAERSQQMTERKI